MQAFVDMDPVLNLAITKTRRWSMFHQQNYYELSLSPRSHNVQEQEGVHPLRLQAHHCITSF
jgi:hypothetical protein